MNNKNLIEILKKKNLVIPSTLISYYKELNINEKELITLSFLMSFNKDVLFDVNYFSNFLPFNTIEIMSIMSSLCDKKLIEMVVKKDDKKIHEYINVDLLYKKIALLIIDEKEEVEEKSNIYSIIEKEFGRTLSPIEYETIKDWIDNKIGEDLILEALKEAVLNGVNNLKYIDKILIAWSKKGYKKASDVRKKKKEEVTPEIFEYDWLEDNE